MNATEKVAKSQQPCAESDGIPLYDRLVLWMFLAGFVLFGVILLGDLLGGLLQ